LMGSSNVFFPNGEANRASLVRADVVSTDVVRTVVAQLRINGAMPFVEAKFIGVVDPWVEMDLSKDGTFINAASYSNLKQLLVGEIGDWMGVRWKRSNFIPILSTLATTNLTFSAQDVGAPQANCTNFTAGSTTLMQVTQLDPVSGFETLIGVSNSVTNAGTFSARVVIGSAQATGTYNVYCSLNNGSVATLQLQVAHVSGTANTITFVAASTALPAGYFVAQATGPVAPPAVPASINVHLSYVFGKEAFGITELAGLQTFLTPPVPSDSDPAVQRRKASWKQIFKAVIKNTNFYQRIESASAFN